MDWFLYDRELRREKVDDVKLLSKLNPFNPLNRKLKTEPSLILSSFVILFLSF